MATRSFHSNMARFLLTLPLSVGGAVLTGCGGESFGGDLSVKPKAHVLPAAEGATVRLPKDEPFSIALFDAQKKALGPAGTVQAEAHAKPDGTADATAGVTDGGQAAATFQLGHAFLNQTEKQVDLEITVRFQYESKVEAAPAAGIADATVALNLYARDGQNRAARTYELMRDSNENGTAGRQSDSQEFHFTLTLGPGATMNVFLAGQASIDAKIGRAVSGMLKIKSFQMEAVTRPAPPPRTTTAP